jgi:hypothetical protein
MFNGYSSSWVLRSAFFLGGRRGTRNPKHFAILTGESKNKKKILVSN